MVQELEAASQGTNVRAFGDRLADAVERKRSQLLVGLDPVPELLPLELAGEAGLGRAEAADACTRFCCGVIDAVAPYAVGVKPQLAFFEALGADGMQSFESVCRYARTAGLIVIADGKRGDIGSTARAYASAYLEGSPPAADAMTVNPYLGRDSLEPFLAACRREGAGIFCLVKTSNEGVADIQDLALSDGQPLWQHVARLVAEWGEELVGDTWPVERRRGRRRDAPARGRRGEAAASALDPAPAGDRSAGSRSGRRRPRLHERPFERARRRVALGALRVQDDRGRLALRGRAGGGAAEERGLDGLRLVRNLDWRAEARRYALPIAFLLLVTAAVLVVRGAL